MFLPRGFRRIRPTRAAQEGQEARSQEGRRQEGRSSAPEGQEARSHAPEGQEARRSAQEGRSSAQEGQEDLRRVERPAQEGQDPRIRIIDWVQPAQDAEQEGQRRMPTAGQEANTQEERRPGAAHEAQQRRPAAQAAHQEAVRRMPAAQVVNQGQVRRLPWVQAQPRFHPYPQNLRVLQMWAERQELQHRRRAGILMYIQERQEVQEGRSQRRQRRPRSCWVKPWKTEEKKEEKGAYSQLLRELKADDIPAFIRYLRFEPRMYHELLQKVGPRIEKIQTNMRKSLDPGHRLAICLRYLATGESYRSLSFQFRVSHQTIGQIVYEVCEALIEVLKDEVMPEEMNVDDWRHIAEGFEKKWNFPHVTGAIDGKHIAIMCPKNSGSEYYNYKKFYSIVLLAVVDADYKFVFVDVGRNGAASDVQVFERTPLKKAIEEGRVGWPAPDPLPNDDGPTPYFMIGDDAFALKEWMMKPYSRRNLTREEKIFNYRLSRARRVAENAFGILVHRFRCLLKTLEVQPDTASSITLACLMLHNLMRLCYPTLDRNQGDAGNSRGQVIRGAWRRRMGLVGGEENLRGNHGSARAKAL